MRTSSLPWVGTRDLSLSDYWLRALAVLGVGAVVAGLVFLYLLLVSDLTLTRREAARAALSVDELQREVLYYENRVEVAFSRQKLEARARALGMEPFDEERITRLGSEDGL
ncbi:MAG: hypothetical protein R6U88_05780 [Candidatus Bipolaricaulota bacterium]